MRILMLGNSLTVANHMPLLLARKLGAKVVVHGRGGAHLAEQLNSETKVGAQTIRALSRRVFDYVLLQEMSYGPAMFPEHYKNSVSRLTKLIREAAAEPVLYASWAFKPGCKKLAELGIDADEMHARMQKTFIETAQDNNVLLANVGEAFYKRGFADELYDSDGLHPSKAGSLLAAEVIAAVIERREPLL